MSKKNNKIVNFVVGLTEKADKNKPAILAGVAVVGVFVTAFSAYKAGIKAKEILDEKKLDLKDVDPKDKETKKSIAVETIKEMVPVVAPPVIMGVATAACIISSHNESAKRIALVSAAYNLSETAVKDLNNKMQEVLGDKKTKTIKDAIVKDKLDADKDNKPSNDVIMMCTDGNVLCKDIYTGRYWPCNAEKIKQAIVKLSSDIQQEMYVELNDLYYEVGLEQIPAGNDLGWHVEDCSRGLLPITLSALLTEDGKPCLCMDYEVSVKNKIDFRNLL